MKKKLVIFLLLIAMFLLLFYIEKYIALVIGFKDLNVPLYTPLLFTAWVVSLAFYSYKFFRQAMQYVLTVFIITLMMIVLIEGVFYFFNRRNEQKAEKRTLIYLTSDGTNRFNQPDAVLGYKPKANNIDSIKFWKQDKHVCDITYHIDSNSMRVNPLIADNPEVLKRKFALFFGCSFTFGDNLYDYETLPYIFNVLDTNYVSYNFACGGYGTQQMWLHLKNPDIKKVVANSSDGAAFYVYIDAHINRVYGGMKEMTQWVGEMPCLELQSDSVVFKGMLNSQHPYRKLIYKLLAKSETLKYFRYDTPKTVSNSTYGLVAKIIAESAESYKEKFKSENFFMVIPPGNDTTILNYLRPYNIKVINLTGITEHLKDPTYCTLIDAHPSAKANKLIAEEIKKALGDF